MTKSQPKDSKNKVGLVRYSGCLFGVSKPSAVQCNHRTIMAEADSSSSSSDGEPSPSLASIAENLQRSAIQSARTVQHSSSTHFRAFQVSPSSSLDLVYYLRYTECKIISPYLLDLCFSW